MKPKYMSFEKYKKEGADVCPNLECEDNTQMTVEHYECSYGKFFVYWYCPICEAQWRETYNLEAMDITKEETT